MVPLPKQNKNQRPVLITSRAVFPLPFLYSIRSPSQAPVVDAETHNGEIIVVAQHEHEGGFYDVGVLCRIEAQPKTLNSINIKGLYRVRILEWIKSDDCLKAVFEPIPDTCSIENAEELNGQIRALLQSLETYLKHDNAYKPTPPDAFNRLDELTDPRSIVYVIAQHMDRRVFRLSQKLYILGETDLALQIKALLMALESELKIIQAQQNIRESVQKAIEENRRAAMYSQIREIAKQLGDDADPIAKYEKLIETTPLTDEARETALEEVAKLKKLYGHNSVEVPLIEAYLDFLLVKMPWGKLKKKAVAFEDARTILDQDHYGMDTVKRRVLKFVAAEKMAGEDFQSVLLLVGPPGTGKTTLVQAMAKAMGREYVSIPCGGLKESDIMGHRKTYVGSMPGVIMKAIARAGCMNPLILLDEFADLGSTGPEAPMRLMKSIINNEPFTDSYLGVPVEFKKVIFVCTANDISDMIGAVLDRMEIVMIEGYTQKQKIEIAKRYLIPAMRKKYKLPETDLQFTDDCIQMLVERYTGFEAGVRNLVRVINDVGEWACTQFLSDSSKKPIVVSTENLDEILIDTHKTHDPYYSTQDAVGCVNGLAWTSSGGVILPVEALLQPVTKNQKREITGNLGKVMEESVKVALSVLQANADEIGVDFKVFEESTIHIHCPAGATPKDGPSAGITIFCALLSAATGLKIKYDVGMTAELSLHGQLLPIGGVKEKLTAAQRAGLTKVLMAPGNKQDIERCPEATEGLTIVFCEHAMDAIPHIFDSKSLQKLRKSKDDDMSDSTTASGQSEYSDSSTEEPDAKKPRKK